MSDSKLLCKSEWRQQGMVPKRGEAPQLIRKRYGGGEIHLYAATQMRPIRKRTEPVPVELSITPENVALACWTVNKTAKRFRDAASRCYDRDKHGFARMHREKKEDCYDLKDLAMAWLAHHGHIAAERIHGGVCLWVGMGYSWHSTLAPNETVPGVDDAPLRVEANAKSGAELRLVDAQHLLRTLPDFRAEFQKLELPRIVRPTREIVCYGCGQPGHIRRDCPEESGDFYDF